MKRSWTVAAVSATLLVLAACANFVIIPPIISDGVAAHPTGFDPALLTRYHRISEHETEEGEIEQTPHYSGIGYHPRQSGYLGYDNWDVLEVPRDSSGINNLASPLPQPRRGAGGHLGRVCRLALRLEPGGRDRRPHHLAGAASAPARWCSGRPEKKTTPTPC